MRVLVACEESQAVCKAFRELGHEAYSCDILPCSGGYPEWHIQDDVLKHINNNWDLIIAHPPCTYLSNAGATHLYPKPGQLNVNRFAKGLEAKQFFLKLLNANCNKICVENPVPSRVYRLPPYNQIIEPYFFGDPFKKKTCLWLKGLPQLKATNIIVDNLQCWVSGGSVKKNNRLSSPGHRDAKTRSKTFIGIAKAMAEQWGGNNVILS